MGPVVKRYLIVELECRRGGQSVVARVKLQPLPSVIGATNRNGFLLVRLPSVMCRSAGQTWERKERKMSRY